MKMVAATLADVAGAIISQRVHHTEEAQFNPAFTDLIYVWIKTLNVLHYQLAL